MNEKLDEIFGFSFSLKPCTLDLKPYTSINRSRHVPENHHHRRPYGQYSDPKK